MVYIDLILNLTLLVALTVVSGFIDRRWPRHTRTGVALQGVLFGGAAVIGMLRPLNFGPGLIFDGRSVMVSLCALYFGPWAALPAAGLPIACRIALGGMGALTGVLVILSSAGVGLAGHYRLAPEKRPPTATDLYLFGLVVHVVMLALMFTLPGGAGWRVIERIGPPVILLYPLAAILAGKILSDQATARQRIAALTESEERYRKLFDNHSAVKLILDAETGAIVDANPAAEGFYGWSKAQLQRMRIQDINTLPGETVGEAIGKVRSEKRIRFEFQHLLKDGSTREVEVFSSRIEVQGKDYLHSIIHDITEQRKLEEQLRQAQKVEAIGRLAGGVAHDFNNMLSVILGYGENLLEELPPDHPMRADVAEIVEAGRRSAGLTRQLLAFSRKQTLKPEVLDLNAVVRNLEKMLGRLIGEDIELTFGLSREPAMALADPGQIEQVIMNLAVNARDAMPRGGRLTIQTGHAELDDDYARDHVGARPGNYVLLAVADTGCGMDKETRSMLFEPFFTTKEKGKGTGLGLASVYGIVKQSGGNIWVYSEPGRGTTFKIYLPRTEAETVEKSTPVRAEKATAEGVRILVVEDDKALRRLCERMLSRLGYRPVIAADGADALRRVEEKESPPDLLMTDVVMPDMSGPALAARLQQKWPDLKVLYMSGYTDSAIVHHGVLDPGVNFIEKPFTARDLADKVQRVLGAADRLQSTSNLSENDPDSINP